jgi:hypothetical protein
MSNRTLTLSTLVSLLVFTFGCDARNDSAPANGSLRVSVSASTELGQEESLRGSLVITGLDQALETRVALASAGDASAVQVSLPPGLYGLEWNATPSFDETSGSLLEPLTASSFPRLVVVASGQVSSVDVRTSPAPSGEGSAVYAPHAGELDAALALR